MFEVTLDSEQVIYIYVLTCMTVASQKLLFAAADGMDELLLPAATAVTLEHYYISIYLLSILASAVHRGVLLSLI